MSKLLIDLIGRRFGHLTVVDRAQSDRHWNTKWRCSCDCGGESIVLSRHLRRGITRSCGCLPKGAKPRHGHSSSGGTVQRSPTYHSWTAMKTRCLNPAHISYPYYGGRGILICNQWLDSFESFLEDMGERPIGTTLDRIVPDGNYEPENCRWATPKVQLINRRPRAQVA